MSAHREEPRPSLSSVPIPANRSAPSRTMNGTHASVSTLLTIVGDWNRPETAGNGGLRRGNPLPPSSEVSSAVSSPQI